MDRQEKLIALRQILSIDNQLELAEQRAKSQVQNELREAELAKALWDARGELS